MTRIREARSQTRLENTESWIQEKLFSALDPLLENETVGWGAGASLEQLRKIVGAHACESSKVRKAEVLVQIVPGAIAVLVRTTLRSQFRRIDPLSTRVVLIDMGKRVLGTESLSEAARKRLEKLGVEVRLGQGVDRIDAEGVIVAGERIASCTVIWTAGVTPSPAGKWLSVPTDRAGRVRVQSDCSVPGHPEVFVVGDTASLDQDGKPLPGVAQVAMQQGRYVGRAIRRRIKGKPGAVSRPFRYFDKGSMAVIGSGFAVLESHKLRIHGFLARLAWAGVHLEFLAQGSLRASVFAQWVWTYWTGRRGSQLIVPHRAFTTKQVSAD